MSKTSSGSVASDSSILQGIGDKSVNVTGSYEMHTQQRYDNDDSLHRPGPNVDTDPVGTSPASGPYRGAGRHLDGFCGEKREKSLRLRPESPFVFVLVLSVTRSNV